MISNLPYYTIPLSKGLRTLVDADTYRELGHLNWCHKGKRRDNYAATNLVVDGRRSIVVMHRLIMGLKRFDTRQVDHINMDGLDNRKENLRLCTLGENRKNNKKYSNNTTGFKGVCRLKGSGRFKAEIMYNRKRVHLGYFNSAEEAHKAYTEAATKHHGEFARFN